MKYPESPDFHAPSTARAELPSRPNLTRLTTWRPSTWPPAPKEFNESFHAVLERIFRETMVDELRNVVTDIEKASTNPSTALVHRGHVIAVAYMCALDAVSRYGYKNKHVKKFVRAHFPPSYKPYAGRIYPDYRIDLVHSWNLFGNVALLPGHESMQEQNGGLCFGILNFADAFEYGVCDFLKKLTTDAGLQRQALFRYRVLTGEIKYRRPSNQLKLVGAGFIGGVIATIFARTIARVTSHRKSATVDT